MNYKLKKEIFLTIIINNNNNNITEYVQIFLGLSLVMIKFKVVIVELKT